MKILFMCHALNSGGAERVCVDLANGLNALGHEVMIYTDCSKEIVYVPNSNIELINTAKSRGRFLSRLDSFLQIRMILIKKCPDIIISILFFNSTIAKLASLFTTHCPVILSDHNSYERPLDSPFPFRQFLDKYYWNYLYDCITVLTEADKKHLKGRFKRIEVMPNPLTFEPLKEVPEKEKIVLAVGRLDAWHVKGFDLLINTWKTIHQDCQGWKLRIVGSGSEDSLNYLKELAIGIKSIEFASFSSEIKKEYRTASIFVLSSRYEGFGLVLIEAMSQGCSCIACDYKGRQAEIISNGVNGLLCPVEDYRALAGKIKLLIDDSNLRIKMQNEALHSLERFSIPSIAGKWDDLIKSMTK